MSSDTLKVLELFAAIVQVIDRFAYATLLSAKHSQH